MIVLNLIIGLLVGLVKFLLSFIATFAIVAIIITKPISKYLCIDRKNSKIIISPVHWPYYKFKNRRMTDKEIQQEFIDELQTAHDNLKLGKIYNTVTNGYFLRILKNQDDIEIKEVKQVQPKPLTIINLIIGKRKCKTKVHKRYEIQFCKVEL